MFNLVFTVSVSTGQVSLVFGGYLLDKFGTWVHRGITSVAFVIGALLLALSSPEYAIMLFPSMILIAVGGLNLLSSNIQAGNLSNSYRVTVITLMNGSFDSGMLAFFLFKLSYDSGIDFKSITVAYVVFSLYLCISTFTLMPRKWFPSVNSSSPVPRYGIYEVRQLFCRKNVVINESSQDEDETRVRDTTGVDENSQKISTLNCIKSPLFWTGLLFICFINLRINFFLGSFSSWIASFEDHSSLNTLTNIFGTLPLVGIVVAPINGAMTDITIKLCKKCGYNDSQSKWKGLFTSTFSTSVFAVCFSIAVSLRNTYSSFVFFFITRSFLYASNATFISLAFPAYHFGKLFGIINFAFGMFGLLQFALFTFGLNIDPGFRVTNYTWIAAAVITLVHSFAIFQKSRSQ
uniref:solute carrier family 43 member 3-like n=1 Tax=Ciona intestinalis TaxID=7719 RepID=UPI000180B3EC|nr:solute carrier family 43 member 3-like [Ciona intestinalis]|eukprot:XP_002119729.1 solute carrier family 43 member 3-like [Ciona intestinalis]